jgi:hypothetical protein
MKQQSCRLSATAIVCRPKHQKQWIKNTETYSRFNEKLTENEQTKTIPLKSAKCCTLKTDPVVKKDCNHFHRQSCLDDKHLAKSSVIGHQTTEDEMRSTDTRTNRNAEPMFYDKRVKPVSQ